MRPSTPYFESPYALRAFLDSDAFTGSYIRFTTHSSRSILRLAQLAALHPFEVAQNAAAKEINILEARREAVGPQERQMKQLLMKACDELQAGVRAAERLIVER